MAAARKMDELLVSWLGSDAVYESILELIETFREAQEHQQLQADGQGGGGSQSPTPPGDEFSEDGNEISGRSPRDVIIPPFYPRTRKRRSAPHPYECWVYTNNQQLKQLSSSPSSMSPTLPPPPPPPVSGVMTSLPMMQELGGRGHEEGRSPSISPTNSHRHHASMDPALVGARDHARAIFSEIGLDPPLTSPSSVQSSSSNAADDEELDGESFGGGAGDSLRLRRKYVQVEAFARITKDVCRFPSFFNVPLYQRILLLWNQDRGVDAAPMDVVTYEMLEWYWEREMEPYDNSDRFFRLVKQPDSDYITRNDFLPFINSLLSEHPGLEFLSSHAEFQEKYALTVMTRIFYGVNRCHSGKITSRQIRRSDLLDAFYQVDDEEDINKVTRYLSYEHFYVLYCRFWELDLDRDYRITREDLLKYGDHSLSHMIVDRIFDAAPRPFEQENPNREYLTYESFIYFMLSEEDKSNEVSVRYWFSCVDVDGDGKLNNMEMRSFYAVQLHRMQVMGQEIVPFEDMLCQMMDMIKPANSNHFVVSDFLQPECRHVSGALFDALFNLNKYLMFEQRDPFVERQKREDEFECDWDRFACIDYNRLAMEEEAREEEAMEIDWVTVNEDGDGAPSSAVNSSFNASNASSGGFNVSNGDAGGAAGSPRNGGMAGAVEAPF